MITVVRKNKEMKIMASQKNEFLALGYSVIDESGKIIESGNALTIADFQALVTTLNLDNSRLKEEVEKLKSEQKKIKTENTKLKTENEKLKAQSGE